MSEKPHQKQDLLELAKRQFAQISAEFEKSARHPQGPRAAQAADVILSGHAAKGPVQGVGECREVSGEGRAANDRGAVEPCAGTRLVGRRTVQRRHTRVGYGTSAGVTRVSSRQRQVRQG